jgi:hypothetical protein
MLKKRKPTSAKATNNESTNKTKPAKAYEADEVKRYLGSLSEDFQGKVAAIGEQFGGLNQKIDRHHEEHLEKFAYLYRKLDLHTEMIGGMKEDIEIIKTNIEFLKAAVNVKVDYADFAALEKRLRLVESKLHR